MTARMSTCRSRSPMTVASPQPARFMLIHSGGWDGEGNDAGPPVLAHSPTARTPRRSRAGSKPDRNSPAGTARSPVIGRAWNQPARRVRVTTFREGVLAAPFAGAARRILRTVTGSRSISVSNTRAGPSGTRRPCSQLRSVPRLTPNVRANSSCERSVFSRTALTSPSSAKWTTAPVPSPLTCAMASRRPRAIFLNASLLISLPSLLRFLYFALELPHESGERIALRHRKIAFLGLREERQQEDRVSLVQKVVDNPRSYAIGAVDPSGCPGRPGKSPIRSDEARCDGPGTPP